MALGPQALVPGYHEPPHFDMAKLLIEEAGGLIDTTNSIDDGMMLATYAQNAMPASCASCSTTVWM